MIAALGGVTVKVMVCAFCSSATGVTVTTTSVFSVTVPTARTTPASLTVRISGLALSKVTEVSSAPVSSTSIFADCPLASVVFSAETDSFMPPQPTKHDIMPSDSTSASITDTAFEKMRLRVFILYISLFLFRILKTLMRVRHRLFYAHGHTNRVRCPRRL